MSRDVVSFDVTLTTEERLDAVLAALGAPYEAGPLPGEDVALAAFRSCVDADPKRPRSSRMRLFTPRKAAVIALSGGIVALSAGAAAAATGSLPGAAQDVASAALAKVGISVPGPNSHSSGHADTRGNSATDTTTDTTPANDSHGQGSEISQIARTPDLTGVDKGAAVSTAASDGKSQAGQHGGGAPETTGSADGSAPVSTPNDGGTGTADTASDGASATGTATAGSHSADHSTGGSANAGTHRP